jgi:hypothetical protein
MVANEKYGLAWINQDKDNPKIYIGKFVIY